MGRFTDHVNLFKIRNETMPSDDKLIDAQYGDVWYITIRRADGETQDDELSYSEYHTYQSNGTPCELCGKGSRDGAVIYSSDDNIICRDCLHAAQEATPIQDEERKDATCAQPTEKSCINRKA